MLLVIDNYDSFTYNLVQYLGELGQEVRVIRNDELPASAIAGLGPSHIVISPGPCTPNEAGISLEVIKTYAGKIPILGVCLGHQSIGQAFGVHGPGEITMCVGAGASLAMSAAAISSLRTTRTACPSSPRYWTRL